MLHIYKNELNLAHQAMIPHDNLLVENVLALLVEHDLGLAVAADGI